MQAFPKTLKSPLRRVRFVRSLRFRLAAGFLVIFTLMLTGIGLLFRTLLASIQENQTAAALEEEWGASKGYLRIEYQQPVWYYDRFEPEEDFIVGRIRRVSMIADAAGNLLEVSGAYRELGIDTLDHIKQVLNLNQPVLLVRRDSHGVRYLIRQGTVLDEHHRKYFLAIGRSLELTDRASAAFTWKYFAVLPLLIVVAGALGWLLAGRALKPVNTLADTAHKITGSNLSVRIPLRNAGDELDALIEAFNRMVERLNLSFEQIRRFSTDVSHELRTPLTAIRGQLEVALFTAKTPEQYQDAMVNALQDVEQLSNIVRALLLLSQAESGQLVLQMTSIDLADVAREIVDQYQIPAEAAGVVLSSSFEPHCEVRADKTQMERLVSNLLSNAVKYTGEGGKVHITLRCVQEPAGEAQADTAFAVLMVEDTGIGIPAGKLPHIFDRFYRVRPSHTNPVQGLGLGLSFVSWIVNAHGGRIEVDSQEGQGSRFTVFLPLAPAAEKSSATAPLALAGS